MAPSQEDHGNNSQSPSEKWRFFPPAQWMPVYKKQWFSKDAIAGVTLAAYAIPVSLAYATLAGLPPQYGIYCYMVGGILYAVFGTSKQMAIGPTSAISMLVGSTIAGMANGDVIRWAEIAGLTALLISVMCMIGWALKLSSVVSFISETILVGFKAGAALVISMSQLPKLFGVTGGGEGFFERIYILAGQLGETNLAVLIFGLVAFAFLIIGEKILPGKPVALIVVVISIIILSVTSLSEAGFKIVGVLPVGLPELQLPSLNVRDVDGVFPLAFACLLLAYIEGVSAARTLAEKNNYEIDSRQELLALGAANFAVAFAQGYPVAGGLSQSSVNNKAGAKTPLSLIFASVTIGLCLIFLTGALRNLPTVVLAVIVLVAVKGLIDINAIRNLWRVSRYEFAISMTAFAGVLLLGILKGIVIAAVISIILLLRRASNPHIAYLGRIQGTRKYSDLANNPDNEIIPGVLIFRVESSLIYFNIQNIKKQVYDKIMLLDGTLKLVICDLSATPYVDIAGSQLLVDIEKELKEKGIKFQIVGAHSSVRDILKKVGLTEKIKNVDQRLSIDEVIGEFRNGELY